MGKNLKGKECGKGICQRKDGQYYARFVNKRGKRQDNYFATLPEARNWLEDARYADKHDNVFTPSDMTVDTWFEYWIEHVVGDLAPNSDEAGVKRFCMHALRHTYATRVIESGMQPKVLQKFSGHASIKTTMDRYVHVTDDSLVNAIRQFQQATPPVSKKGVKWAYKKFNERQKPL